MSTDTMPELGSLRNFEEDLKQWGYQEENGWYLAHYEIALSGMQKVMAEKQNCSIIQVHNPEFVEVETKVNPALLITAA